MAVRFRGGFMLILVGVFMAVSGQYQDTEYTFRASRTDATLMANCSIRPTKDMENFFQDIILMTKEGIKVIEIFIVFPNYTVDVLSIGNTQAYEMNYFGRANTPQGMRILDLDFHYDLTQLARWTMGIKSMTLNVYDTPTNCTALLEENDKQSKLIHLLSPPGDYDFYRLCHKIVKAVESYAYYSTACCYYLDHGKMFICEEEQENYWLVLLGKFLFHIRIIIFLIGPLYISKNLQGVQFYTYDYYVKPRTSQKILICSEDITQLPKNSSSSQADRKSIINLSRSQYKFTACKEAVSKLTATGSSLKRCLVRINRFKISANHRSLLTEHEAPVGLWQRFSDVLANRKYGPKQTLKKSDSPLRELLGKIVLLLLVGLPYYIRILIFYFVELPKLQSRWDITHDRDLKVPYNWNMISYLTPLHFAWIILYANYMCTLAMAVSSPNLCTFSLANSVRDVTQNALAGLQNIDYSAGFRATGSLLIWPFRRYGCLAVIVAPIWLVLTVPCAVTVITVYVTPLLYLSARVVFGGSQLKQMDSNSDEETNHKSNEEKVTKVDSFSKMMFQLVTLFSTINVHKHCSIFSKVEEKKQSNLLANVVARAMVFTSLISAMIILSECTGFVIDLVILTLIGIIANAETQFKYITILGLITFYTWDVFKDVKNIYRKLTSAMCQMIEDQLEDLQNVLDLPSNIQENTAFIVEETPDKPNKDITLDDTNLRIGQLALFVDNCDTPRIPRELFEAMVNVNIVGTPGPIMKTYIREFVKLSFIVIFLVFMFLIILALGEDYNISTGSSLFATAIGGALPLLLKAASKTKSSELQLCSLAFKGKLDEKIARLYQSWPLVDMEIEVCENQETDEDDDYDDYNVVIINKNEQNANTPDVCDV